jgi:hypothetical protein
MLNAVEDRARERGWLVVSETATAGFVSRMVRQLLPGLLREFDPATVRRRMTGLDFRVSMDPVRFQESKRFV